MNNPVIPHFYCVTFDESVRRESFAQRANEAGIRFSFVFGTSKMSSPCITRYRNTHLHTPAMDNAYAKASCFLSHLAAIYQGYRSDAKYFGVLEDDVVFATQFQTRLGDRFNNLPEGWNMLMLCTYQQSWDGCLWAGKDTSLKNLALVTKKSFGAIGYILTHQAAERIVLKYGKFLGDVSNDLVDEIITRDITSEWMTQEFAGDGGYMSSPFIISETSEISYIQSPAQLSAARTYFEHYKKYM